MRKYHEPKKEPASTTAVVLFILFGVFAMAGAIIAILLSLPHPPLRPPVITIVPVKPHEITPQNPSPAMAPAPVPATTNTPDVAPATPTPDSSQPSAPAPATQAPVQEVPQTPAQTAPVAVPTPAVEVPATIKVKPVKRHHHHHQGSYDECD